MSALVCRPHPLCTRGLQYRLYASLAVASKHPLQPPRCPEHQHESKAHPPISAVDRTPPQFINLQRNSTGGDASSHESRQVDETEAVRRNPLEPNKLDVFLSSLHNPGWEPTLADIERYRPDRHSHAHLSQYAEEYNRLVDTLCRSFSKAQLRRFSELYHLPGTRSLRKVQYAERIIEKQWKWPSLKDVERRKKEMTEVSLKSFSISPSHLFLLLGKDGVDLLQMSSRFNVHISLTPDPLTLHVEGLNGSLTQVCEKISKLRVDTIEEILELPTKKPIRADLLQRISRVSGAFIENVGNNGMVRLCAKNPRDLVAAKRLATRAACEAIDPPLHPLLSYIPPDLSGSTPVPTTLLPRAYCAYPFLSSRPLPWTVGNRGTFRVRRVSEWLGLGAGENIQKYGGLAGGKGRFVTPACELLDLREILFDTLPKNPESNLLVTASIGHVLLTTSTPTQRPLVLSPLASHNSMLHVLSWLQNHSIKADFVPSLPISLLNSTPSLPTSLHRLIYHALPASASPTPKNQTSKSSTLNTQTKKVIKYDIFVHRDTMQDPQAPKYTMDAEIPGVHGLTESHSPLEDFTECLSFPMGESSRKGSETKNHPKIRVERRGLSGSETTVDLMIPDRPLDVQFSVLNFKEFQPSQEPIRLSDYLSDLQDYLESEDAASIRPEPPLTITYDNDTYVLHSNASVRQSLQNLPGDDTGIISAPPTKVISENVLDLESDYKSAACQVTCNTSEESWKTFLSTCDYLTTLQGVTGRANVEQLDDF